MSNHGKQHVPALWTGVACPPLHNACFALPASQVRGHTTRRPRLDTLSFRWCPTRRPPAGKGQNNNTGPSALLTRGTPWTPAKIGWSRSALRHSQPPTPQAAETAARTSPATSAYISATSANGRNSTAATSPDPDEASHPSCTGKEPCAHKRSPAKPKRRQPRQLRPNPQLLLQLPRSRLVIRLARREMPRRRRCVGQRKLILRRRPHMRQQLPAGIEHPDMHRPVQELRA